MDATVTMTAPPWDDVAASLVRAEQELARIEQFVDGLGGQLGQLWDNFDDRRAGWLRQHEAREQSLGEDRQALLAERARLAEQSDAAQAQGHAADSQLLTLQHQLTEQQELLAAERARLESARAELAAAEQLMSDSQSELERTRGEVSSKEQSWTAARAALEAQVAERAERERLANQSLSELAGRCSDFEAQLRAARDEVALGAAAEKRVFQLERELDLVHSELQVSREGGDLAERCALLESEQTLLQKKYTEAQAELQRSQAVAQQVDGLQQALERTRAELGRKQQEWELQRQAATRALRDRVETLETELNESRGQSAKLAEVAIDLADARAELAAAREALHQHREADAVPAAAEAESERQIADLQAQRGALEQELETVRYRAAELVETAADERRRMSEERSAWAGELKALRRTLEQPGPRQTPRTSEPALSNTIANEAAVRDTVLESVMAQFEKLQKDAVARRGRPTPTRSR